MASYNLKNTDAEYRRCYEITRGMDRTGISAPTERFRSVTNMYVDHERGGDCLESLPGYRRLCKLSGGVNGIYRHVCNGVEHIIVHAGGTLYQAKISDIDSDGAFSQLCSVKDARSNGFTYKDQLFILDGEGIYIIDSALSVSTLASEPAYVPTTYKNGERLEKKNMLSTLSIERHTISSTDDRLYESEGIEYSILDPKEKTCCVSGFSGSAVGALYIPRYTDIGGVKYEVCEIADYALRGQELLTALYTSAGLLRIGKSAVRGCTSLETVQLSTTVESLGEYSFYGCSALKTLYLGEGIKKIGPSSFGACYELSEVNYERDYTSYTSIEGIAAIPSSITPTTFSQYTAVRIGLPLFGSVNSVSAVYLNGGAVSFSHESQRRLIYLDFTSPAQCEGGDFQIYVLNAPSYETEDFSASSYFNISENRSAVLGCTVGEVFDGRIFLSGNPNLPGAVFYSGIDLSKNHNRTYFRECDYFIDGEGAEGISSMLPLTDSLLVFRRGNADAGSIFYHKLGADENYPVYYVHRGISVLSKSYTLYDDALFLSPDGVCTIQKKVYSDYNKLSSCSKGIFGDFKISNDTRFDFVSFKGYMVIIAGDKMYLGDLGRSYKQGEISSYEWFRAVGVGDYESDSNVYRYSEAYEGLSELTEKLGERADGVVMNQVTESGVSVYYVETDGKKYAVLPTEERTGGSFYPATTLFSSAGLLFFGTDSGAICVFNTDKIGVAPPGLAATEDFDMTSYERDFGDRLHPYYYSFMGHAPLCEIESADDNLDTASLTKSTVKGSFALTLRAEGEREPTLLVSTDGSDYKEIPLSRRRYGSPERFKLTADEKEKGYVEKRFKLSSSEYSSPFGVYSIEYRYKIKGRMKK